MTTVLAILSCQPCRGGVEQDPQEADVEDGGADPPADEPQECLTEPERAAVGLADDTHAHDLHARCLAPVRPEPGQIEDGHEVIPAKARSAAIPAIAESSVDAAAAAIPVNTRNRIVTIRLITKPSTM